MQERLQRAEAGSGLTLVARLVPKGAPMRSCSAIIQHHPHSPMWEWVDLHICIGVRCLTCGAEPLYSAAELWQQLRLQSLAARVGSWQLVHLCAAMTACLLMLLSPCRAEPALLPPGKDSRLVGTVSLSFDASSRETFDSLAPPQDETYLANMAVDPKFRRCARSGLLCWPSTWEAECSRCTQAHVWDPVPPSLHPTHTPGISPCPLPMATACC
jgi:hypothetical protein